MSETQTYKTLTEAQLGFVFSVPHTGGDDIADGVYALQDAAYGAVEKALGAARDRFSRTDEQGDFSYMPYGLCEVCHELELEGERVELTVWFESGAEFPFADAVALRELTEASYQAVASEMGIESRYERAESYITYRVAERRTYLGV